MGYAQSIYLSIGEQDLYQELYDLAAKLNGDFIPFPIEIESMHGQAIVLRERGGSIANSISIQDPGSELRCIYFSTDCASSYLAYLSTHFLIHKMIEFAAGTASISSMEMRKFLPMFEDTNLDSSSEKDFEKIIISKSRSLMLAAESEQLSGTLRSFILYCIENDFWGFSERILVNLSELSIKDKNTKTRVSLLDHEYGPYTRSEVADITAMLDDLGVEDRTMVKISMSLGLRPIQIALLREVDLFQDSDTNNWYLNVPSVKGKKAALRRSPNNMVTRAVSDELAGLITAHIQNNHINHPDCLNDLGSQAPRPLFFAKQLNRVTIGQPKLREWAWHSSSSQITKIFDSISEALAIPSRYHADEDGRPQNLRLTAYRFRYTLGTRAVLDGKTPDEVALLLDHSNTASVHHYFKYNMDTIQFIDDAFSGSVVLNNAVTRWQGYLIDEDAQIEGTLIRRSEIASLGKCLKQTRCEYHPTISCYGCGKFRPFKHADHQSQLELIKLERDFVASNSSGPVKHQLDEALEGAKGIVEAQKQLLEESND